MLVSVLLSAFLGSFSLALIIYLMGSSFWEAAIVYAFATMVILLGVGILRARLAAAQRKDKQGP